MYASQDTTSPLLDFVFDKTADDVSDSYLTTFLRCDRPHSWDHSGTVKRLNSVITRLCVENGITDFEVVNDSNIQSPWKFQKVVKYFVTPQQRPDVFINLHRSTTVLSFLLCEIHSHKISSVVFNVWILLENSASIFQRHYDQLDSATQIILHCLGTTFQQAILKIGPLK